MLEIDLKKRAYVLRQEKDAASGEYLLKIKATTLVEV
jgi:hypothetical protein